LKLISRLKMLTYSFFRHRNPWSTIGGSRFLISCSTLMKSSVLIASKIWLMYSKVWIFVFGLPEESDSLL
jgi:hypothetical protein